MEHPIKQSWRGPSVVPSRAVLSRARRYVRAMVVARAMEEARPDVAVALLLLALEVGAGAPPRRASTLSAGTLFTSGGLAIGLS